MGLFDYFRKKKQQKKADDQMKWNLMWSMWARGMIPAPYAQLMTYSGEVNNGGHDQYFVNTENNGDLQQEMAYLERILPQKLKRNLQTAYQTHLAWEAAGKDEIAAFEATGEGPLKALAEASRQCDDVFYENEHEITCILEAYAARLKIRTEKDRQVKKLIAESVDRVKHMEAVFDALSADHSRADLLQELTAYYDGGKWKHDYQLDEIGLLPKDLKRGVLSQDGVYNLLEEISNQE